MKILRFIKKKTLGFASWFAKASIKKKAAVIAAGTLLLIGANALFGSPKAAPLQFAEAKKQTIREEIAGSGTLTGKSVANIRFKSSGRLAFISVNIGDEVVQGQTIAGLDTVELANALRQAENTLRDKRAVVDKIHNDLKDVKDETYTQRQTRTTAEVAQDNAYDSVLAAQKALQDTVVYSPIAGIITQAVENTYQTVSPTDVIAQVVDTSETFFDMDVDEADIGKVEIGKAAEVTLDAHPERVFKGTVNRITPQTKATTSGATVITVRIKLDTAAFTFVNGLSGQGIIVTKEAKQAITIPQEALRDDDTVFVERNGSLHEQKVTPGIRSDTDVEIKKGIDEYERVLLNPPAVGTQITQHRSPLGGVFRMMQGRLFGGTRRER